MATTYNIPIFFEPFEKKKKAARLLHLLAGFLMIANAWGDFKNPTPNLLFVVVQIAAALILISYAFTGKKWSANQGAANGIIRILGAVVLFHAASYFYTINDSLRSLLQVFGAAGLLLLFFTERKIFKQCVVTIDEKGVHTPANLKDRVIEWKDIENMIVKNDFVSINTVQNHFIQYETGAVLSELQMDEMNAYCRSKFTKS
ncbi:MAG: hypothetical protein ACOVP7_00240 [Lacibacter sp.]